jgi:hypothetical protein
VFGTHADRRQQDGPDSSEQCGGGGCPCTCSGSIRLRLARACLSAERALLERYPGEFEAFAWPRNACRVPWDDGQHAHAGTQQTVKWQVGRAARHHFQRSRRIRALMHAHTGRPVGHPVQIDARTRPCH